MILFRDDWDLYPNAIVDVNTRSSSALKTATIYKRMGIKNHSFILQLHHHELSGIDVYSDPSDELKILVAMELAINPWYYFREVANAPASGGATPSPFRLNRANVALFWSFFNHMITILIQARQTGKTLSLDQLKIVLLQYYTTNASMGLFTKNAGLRAKNIETIKELMDSLPRWLDFRTKGDANNTEEITVQNNNNKLTTAVAQSTKAAAMNVFRGETKPIIDIDEGAFIVNIDLSLGAMLPAMGAASDNAEASGLPYGLNITTTAGYLDMPSGKYFHENLYKKAARFSETFFDLQNAAELKKVVAANGYGSRNSKILIEMNHRDLGYTDDWLVDKISKTTLTPEQIAAEYLLRWNAGKVTSALDRNTIKRLNDHKREPNYVDIREYGFIVSWYIPEEQINMYRYEPFIIGIDSSDAIGNDGISFVGRNYKTGAVICSGKFNNANLDDFGYFIYMFLEEFTKSVLVIEKRSSATAILDQISKLLHASGDNIFRRVFNWVVNDKEEHPDRYEELLSVSKSPTALDHLYIKFKKFFGYGTSGSGRTSRDNLYGRTFISNVRMVAEHIFDRDLVTELTLLEKKNGRIDHKHDEHDDMVIGFLLCSWFLTSANNLSFYGFNPSLALATLLTDDSEAIASKEKMDKRREDAAIAEEISELIERIKLSKNDGETFMIKAKISSLKAKLGSDSITKNTEQQLLEALALKNKNTNRPKLDLSSLY